MLFVNKFWSHINYYNITHDIPDLVFKHELRKHFQHELRKHLPVQRR